MLEFPEIGDTYGLTTIYEQAKSFFSNLRNGNFFPEGVIFEVRNSPLLADFVNHDQFEKLSDIVKSDQTRVEKNRNMMARAEEYFYTGLLGLIHNTNGGLLTRGKSRDLSVIDKIDPSRHISSHMRNDLIQYFNGSDVQNIILYNNVGIVYYTDWNIVLKSSQNEYLVWEIGQSLSNESCQLCELTNENDSQSIEKVFGRVHQIEIPRIGSKIIEKRRRLHLSNPNPTVEITTQTLNQEINSLQIGKTVPTCHRVLGLLTTPSVTGTRLDHNTRYTCTYNKLGSQAFNSN